MGSSDLEVLTLEPILQSIEDGTLVDIVVQLDFHIPGCTVGTSKVHQQRIFTDCCFQGNRHMVTLFRVMKTKIGSKTWLKQTDQTFVAEHPIPASTQLGCVIETCAGIGAVDVGYEHVGAEIIAANEINPKFAEVLESQGRKVVRGDNTLPENVIELAKNGPCIVSGGVSCQPFSRLGDGNEGLDNRSRSLTGTLHMIHLLQAPVGIMECTPVAMQSKWFQSQLKQFCEQSGFKLHQKILELHHSWPAKRSRWWGVVSKPEIAVQDIPDMPKLAFDPTFFHLFPKLKPLEVFEADELALDLYELSNFHSQPKGVAASTIDYYKALPTATHSWGSQLKPCPCGCRQSGFRMERIAEKGLYGQLIPTKGYTGTKSHGFPSMRHMHAKEVALANGLLPSTVSSHVGNQRLMLAGVGQMASPLQGMWVYSNIVANCEETIAHQSISPLQIMEQYVEQLFHERDQMLNIGHADHNQYMQAFQQAWKSMVEPSPPVVDNDPIIDENPKTDASECHKPAKPLQPTTSQKGKGVGGQHSEPFVQALSQDVVADESLIKEVIRCETEFARVNQTDDFQKGGVPGFAVLTSPPSSEDSIQHTMQTKCDQTKTVEETKPIEKRRIQKCVIEVPDAKRLCVKIPEGTKVHQIADAEAKLGTMQQPITITDTMGKVLHPQTIAEDMSNIRFQQGGLTPNKCPKGSNGEIPQLSMDTRENLLWQQEGWIAVDEMQFYAGIVNSIKENHVHPCTSLPDNPTKVVEFGKVIYTMLQMADNLQAPVVTSFLEEAHWTPVSVERQNDIPIVQTTPMQVHHIRRMCEESFGETNFQFVSRAIPNEFHADCGFQALGWMMEVLAGLDTQTPVTTKQAHVWRNVFHEHLIRQDVHQTVVTHPLNIGGMQSQQDQLQQLIEMHGVVPQRSASCAEELINALGSSTIASIMKSSRPWPDLKARANLHKPPIRVVLPSELQEAIKNRAEYGPIGKKQNKTKAKVSNESILQLQANQITVPYAVFKQEDGKEIGQIQPAQIHGSCKGVIIMNAAEAVPYLQVSQPVSQEGVALLIIDHEDQKLPEHKQILRIPAQCNATQEPIILTVAMYQIGKQTVSRNLPDQCIEIEEVANRVLRILVFRDQQINDWEEFAKGPVKMIMEQKPFCELPSQAVLDVWDRQFVNLRMQKETPVEAKVFMVNMRITKDHAEVVTATSGTSGMFIEPRSSNGRQPHDDYQVIWLPRKNFSEALVAKQMTKVNAVLVRYGDKYGLRVHNEHAQQVHGEHRPDLQYLDGSALKKFKVGPLPYGSTKQSIVNAFGKWGWAARPVGPQGQSSDRTGTMWLVQATTDPSHWVFQMQHGDVLISPETSVQTTHAKPSVIASAKTIQSLKEASKPAMQRKEDPWLHKDPWQAYSSGSSSKEVSVASMQAQLESTIDKKIRESIPPQADCVMTDATDSRIVQLEHQVQQLTGSLQSFEQRQTAHNQTVYAQVQKMDQKMQDQHVTINRMLDSKLADQMQKIEALLTKRNRTE